jgi:hypothetical protein
MWWRPSLYLYLSFGCKRLMTGRLRNWVTFSVPHIQPRRKTILKGGVDIVGILIWRPTFRTIHTRTRRTRCPLGLDLPIDHDRFGSISDPSLNGHLHYPNDIDKSLNEVVVDKIRKYHVDYNNNPPITVSFIFSSRLWIFSQDLKIDRNFIKTKDGYIIRNHFSGATTLS